MSYKSVQLQVGEGPVEDAAHAKVRRICRYAGLLWINKDVSQQTVWKPGREGIDCVCHQETRGMRVTSAEA